MTDTPRQLKDLVERFHRNIESYYSPVYNEAQVRLEFLNPFFESLGWDIANKAGHGEAYKDVLHEDAIKVGGATKAPDYSFRIGGMRKFFLEAKKPALNIRQEPGPAYQLRRYAWSAKLPLSLLTNFAEFAVYDCRLPPKETDKASLGRILYLTYKEYIDRWEEIASIFSKHAVLQGFFDKFAESGKGKRGTSQVDAAFLTEIEGWRESLARNLALRNPRSSVRDVNFAVQRTIDRIIFLRMCEDRAIEPYGQLQALLNGENVYKRLHYLYNLADDRYNSGLFHFREERGRAEAPDELTLKLKIDDKVLKDIIRRLYYPESPYEFSVLGADILGNVYEQFLGKVIRLTPSHRAIVEERPEVKKAGGVYYTPGFIVDYIVKNTVGSLAEGKSPNQITRLRILDPACGSGSFLIAAYTFLLNYHRDWYVNHDPHRHAKHIYAGPGGQWLLTTSEKKRILLNNIYGVDIDSQAVEVTKLSLLLKVLEGENQETLSRQLKMWRERTLPDLGNNIKCGNSLIGPDFYQNQQINLLDPEERYRINAFDWNSEFADIIRSGGFEAVIGNPPWGADFSEAEKRHLDTKYLINTGKYESYIFFIERGTSLLRSSGVFGFIVPSYWVSRSQTEPLRQLLSDKMVPQSFIILPENVFTGVKMDAAIVIARKPNGQADNKSIIMVGDISADQLSEGPASQHLEKYLRAVRLADWNKHPRFRFNPRISQDDTRVIELIEADAMPLGSITEISQGLTLYRLSTLIEAFGNQRAEEILKKRLFHADYKKDRTYKKELSGRDVGRYWAAWDGNTWVSYGPWLAHAVDERFFHGPRLVVQKLRNPILKQRLVAGYLDDDETYSAGVLLNVIPASKSYSIFYVLGLMNSKLLNYWYRKVILDLSIRVIDLKALPIRAINFDVPAEITRHSKMVALVHRILGLYKELATTKNPNDKTRLQREIEATDRQIDQLVYELYGLTDREISIVEDATR